MNSGKLTTGVLLGAAAGAILGVLLAPDKGSETRKKISKTSTDLKDSLKGKFTSMAEDLSSKYDEVLGNAENLVENGKEQTNKMKNKLEGSMS